nr:MAG TPA: hypothetical protein [Caudoviricetes sp.]
MRCFFYAPTMGKNWRRVETKNKQACGYGVLILLTNQHLSKSGAFFILKYQLSGF